MLNNQERLLVSIQCLVYNHEPYLRQCLDGFVMQKTNFKFEAIVHDDVSTDNSAAIIREYAEKYPDIIKPIFETENQYSKHDGSLDKIMADACNGKYIALCEGDDYWIDPLKLQKQVDFMESNIAFSMCFHMVDIRSEGNMEKVQYFEQLEDREYSPNEIIRKWIIPTCSMFYRSEVNARKPHNSKFVFGDDVIYATCLSLGKIYGMSDIMGVYRLVPTGWMATHSGKNRLISSISQRKGLMEEFAFYHCDINYTYMQNVYFKLMSILVLELNFHEFKSVYDDYKQTLPQTSATQFMLYFIRFLARKFWDVILHFLYSIKYI